MLALGRAAARVLGIDEPYLIGRDTRRSGGLIQAALTAGLTAEGADVVDLGVLPTPAVAAACAAAGRPGAVISASHNPFPDNGVKLFAPGGRKLTDDVEERLEAELGSPPAAVARVAGEIGTVTADPDAGDAYVDRVTAALEGRTLEGVKVVLDCANGAASTVAGEAFRRAGAEVTVLNAQPDGTNINHGCGSTHPEGLQDAVLTHSADMGLAFDGDADRVLAVDATGNLVDGDRIIALCALDLRERDRLSGNTVVVTVMTNLGFRLAMADAGITVHETKVGDRYVLEALDDNGWSLGGEQSGHVIFRDLATTGDGILTGLLLTDAVKRAGRPFADLAGAVMASVPQVLLNVRVADRGDLDHADAVWEEVRAVESELGDRGRVLLRPSGTEPVIRVMVEAPEQSTADAAAERVARAVTAALGS